MAKADNKVGPFDPYGRMFTYWHGTSQANLASVLTDGLKPGSNGYLYVSLRQDFAKNYGDILLQIRLPYELPRNPFSPTINGECRTSEPVPADHIQVLISAQQLEHETKAAVEAAVLEARIAEHKNLWDIVPPDAEHVGTVRDISDLMVVKLQAQAPQSKQSMQLN